MSKLVARELRGVQAVSGGPGVIILVRRNGRLLSGGACRALEAAAADLGIQRGKGFLDRHPWAAVARGVGDGQLGRMLTVAVAHEESGAPAKDAPQTPPRRRKGRGQ